MLKKILSILLLLTLTLGLFAGCSEKKDEEVNESVREISFDEDYVYLTVGEQLKLDLDIKPSKAKDADIDWKSSDTSIVSVSNGRVTAKAPGTAIITAKSENGKTATCTITVGTVSSDVYETLLPSALGFEKVDIISNIYPSTVKSINKDVGGSGYIVEIETKGYKTEFVILVAVSKDHRVVGSIVARSQEVLGAETTYGESFVGKDVYEASEVDIISGVTLTTRAYKQAIIDALNSAMIASGGSIDLRTEEE